jgi:hypothetical protein
MQRKTLAAALLATGALMGVASVAQAVPAVVATPGTYYSYSTTPPVYAYPNQPTIIVQSAPPAPVYEAMPAPRAGYIWAPGHYVWRDGRYLWNGGHWVASRPGYAWQAAHWEQRGDGSWFLVGGNWVPAGNMAWQRSRPYGDMDRDGVPNRYDGDRDGDGVPNNYDMHPRNGGRG